MMLRMVYADSREVKLRTLADAVQDKCKITWLPSYATVPSHGCHLTCVLTSTGHEMCYAGVNMDFTGEMAPM
jgi:hypothetical protein